MSTSTYSFKRIDNPDNFFQKYESAESKYWKVLKLGSVYKLDGPIVSIAHANARGQYVVGEGNKLHLYRTRRDRLSRTFGRFKSNVRSCSFREDGELLATSEENGLIRVFNMNSLHVKSALRLFKGHRGATSSVHFLASGDRLASGGHDGTVRLWDLPTQACVSTLGLRSSQAAGEQVRSVDVSHRSPNLVAAASFDGVVRLFDLRRDPGAGPALALDHGEPLTAVALAPADNLLVAAGGRTVRVWALGGVAADPLAELHSHHKTATALAFGRGGDRLLTAGLDGLVKVHRLPDCAEVFQWELTSRITAASLAEDDRSLVLGGDDGLLHTKRPREDEDEEEEEKRAAEAKARHEEPMLPSEELERVGLEEEARMSAPGSRASLRKRKLFAAEMERRRLKLDRFVHEEDAVVHPALSIPKEVLNYAKHDRNLQQFQHTKALIAAVRPKMRQMFPERTLAVIQELIRRRALRLAIAGQGPTSGLSGLLCFVRKNIWRPTYSASLQIVVQYLFEIHGDSGILYRPPLVGQMKELERVISHELKFINASRVFLELLDSVDRPDPVPDSVPDSA